MIQLHYYPGNASLIVHILLEEMGEPFERVLVDRALAAHKSPAYLKLNPNGLIPVLSDDAQGPLVLYETAAICLHLCDTRPAGGLAPELGSVARAHFYKWLMWLTNTVQSTLIVYFYPERWVDEGNAAGVEQVKAQAQARVDAMLAQIDAELARVQVAGPWFMGAQYSALDPYVFTLCRWTRGFSAKPARAYPHTGPYLQRMLERPAVRKALLAEQLPQPWV